MNLSRHEHLGRFIVAGSVATSADALVYWGILQAGWPHPIAKAGSYALGIALAFVLHKTWTHRSPAPVRSEAPAFALLYALALGINVGTHAASWAVLGWLAAPPAPKAWASFLFATVLSALWNYTGQSRFVFSTPDE